MSVLKRVSRVRGIARNLVRRHNTLVSMVDYNTGIPRVELGGFHGSTPIESTEFFELRAGHILTVQSNQFCVIQKAECAVQVAKLCSPKYVL